MKLVLFVALALFSAGAIQAQPTQNSWSRPGEGYRSQKLATPASGKVGFTLLEPSHTRLEFTNTLSEEKIAANRVLPNGSGAAVGDYDGDGWPDIFLGGLESGSALFRNLGGWRFTNATQEARLDLAGKMCRGGVFADINGDAKLDLLVTTFSEGVLCYLNAGQGQFTNTTAAAGLAAPSGATTLALADVDGNGSLDLYVVNYRTNDIRDRGRLSLPASAGRPIIPAEYRDRLVYRDGQLLEYGEPDVLYLNDGLGKFKRVAWTDGTFLDEEGKPLKEPPRDWGLAASFRDANNDLLPDLYVCNDYWTPDRFWINQSQGRFRAIARTALRQISSSSMGVDFADLDRDGSLEFFVVDMLSRDWRLRKRQSFADKMKMTPVGAIEDRPQVMRNTLYRNRGDGTFAEVANYGRVTASDWSWSPYFVDVDLDGFEDLLISAGHFQDVQDMDANREIARRQRSSAGIKDETARQQAFTKDLLENYRLYPKLNMPIVAFRNSGTWMFNETTDLWGLEDLAIHHGMALGDFDADGDLDIVVNNLNAPAGLYRNDGASLRVAVRLIGRPPNTAGIGSKIILRGGPVEQQGTEIVSGGRYLSGSEASAVFAATPDSAMSIEVLWRSGSKSVVSKVEANRLYEIEEPKLAENPGPPVKSEASQERALFEDISNRLPHVHHETPFNDYERQPLLPFKLSQNGPGIAWFDLDGDERDELIIGAGLGGAPAIYNVSTQGVFTVLAGAATPLAGDASGLLGWTNPAGERQFLVGLTGYEQSITGAVRQFIWRDRRLTNQESFTGTMTAASALAMGDLDGSGQMVLFAGGGVLPGQYPLGAPSKLYRQTKAGWQLDAKNSILLDNIGIVNGAVWSDVTGEGNPELILACEWGPVRVFQNRDGAIFEVTSELGLDHFAGWWKGVTTGDLNGDGRLDIVAANWGLNSPYEASVLKPLVLMFGELAVPGRLDIIETTYSPETSALTTRRHLTTMGNSLPFLFEQFTSHKAYSEATLDEMLGARKVLARSVQITTLQSMAFMNRGGYFEPVMLPMEAQLAPAFSVNIADFDGDGQEDVFLSQNFFQLQPEIPRLDAGRGLLLLGNGKGGLTPAPGQRSGLKIYGEQRGAAVADFDEDGRTDLVVSQNGAAMKVYRNALAKPGLRVKLSGPPGNAHGYGALVRLSRNGVLGPGREVHGGSGHLSQDSSTVVLAGEGAADAVWIKWPGGRITTTAIPSQAREVKIDDQGKLLSQR